MLCESYRKKKKIQGIVVLEYSCHVASEARGLLATLGDMARVEDERLYGFSKGMMRRPPWRVLWLEGESGCCWRTGGNLLDEKGMPW